jgi:molybdopterin converting factor small subunit
MSDEAITIEVKIHAAFDRYLAKGLAGNTVELSIDKGATVQLVLEEKLNFPKSASKLILVNGIHADKDAVLKDGDRIGLFPLMAGGL